MFAESKWERAVNGHVDIPFLKELGQRCCCHRLGT